MNLGLLTSYIIGGMLMLAILAMNMNLSHSSSELTLNHTTGRHVRTISEMLSYDIPKIGYDIKQRLPNSIAEADSHRIVFDANIDNLGEVEDVMWELTNSPVNRTENPDDRVLVRRVKSKSTGVVVDKRQITLGVIRFRLNYYSGYGKTEANRLPTPVSAADLDKIRQIEVMLICESPQKMNGMWSINGEYVRSAWQKRFSPLNLQEY